MTATQDQKDTLRAFPPNPFRGQTDWDVPEGTYPAICIDVEVLKDVQRKRWQSDEVQTVNLVAFLFELGLPDGTRSRIATKLMTLSLYEKSNLFSFLRDWQGRPGSGAFDPDAYMGASATITVECVPGRQRPDLTFARIARISPPVCEGREAPEPATCGGKAKTRP